jgi:hypothetical protein
LLALRQFKFSVAIGNEENLPIRSASHPEAVPATLGCDHAGWVERPKAVEVLKNYEIANPATWERFLRLA